MTDIASNVERIIEKLDNMTTEVVPKTYGTDIASKVEHISKQLDYVQAGGGSGGEEQGRYVHFQYTGVDSVELTDVSFDELTALCKADKCLGGIVVSVDTSGDTPIYTYNVYNYIRYSEYENSVVFERDTISHPYGSSTTGTLYSYVLTVSGYSGVTIKHASFTLTKNS